jgi:hypothetical protein
MRKQRTLENFGLTLLAVAAAVIASHVATAASATSNVTATNVPLISIAKTADLNFGSTVSGIGTSGTVVVPASASPTRTYTGGVTLANATGTSAGTFNVTGQANATYAITLPGASTVTFAGNTMGVNAYTSVPAGTGTLSAGGAQTIYVGATLNVNASQAQFTYSGTFDVTVAYN